MRTFLINLLIRLIPESSKLHYPVRTHHKKIKRWQFTFDTYWLEFYDKEHKQRYLLRPTGNPVPYIVDELTEMTGSMKSAIDIYSKFTMASANVTKKWHNAFKVKVFK